MLPLIEKLRNRISSLENKIEDSGWIDLDLESGFTTATWDPLQCRKIGSVVYLRGYIKSDHSLTWGDKMATLPVGYIPTAETDITCRTIDDPAVGIVVADTGGNLGFLYKANSSNENYGFIINTSFPVD